MSKILKIILIALAIIAISFVSIRAKEYYDETYVGADYYMRVPSDQDTTIEEWRSGNYDIKGRKYEFTAYNEKGEPKVVKFSITDDAEKITSEDQLLQPNAYIKVNASQKRVISWSIVEEKDVPKSALKFVIENHK